LLAVIEDDVGLGNCAPRHGLDNILDLGRLLRACPPFLGVSFLSRLLGVGWRSVRGLVYRCLS